MALYYVFDQESNEGIFINQHKNGRFYVDCSWCGMVHPEVVSEQHAKEIASEHYNEHH